MAKIGKHYLSYDCNLHFLMEEIRQSSQVTFIYIALLTIQIVSKHLTVSSWRIESQ